MLSPDEFLRALEQLYKDRREHAVYMTTKSYVPRESTEAICLLRATSGNQKISTQIHRDHIQAFYKQCKDVMRRCMSLSPPLALPTDSTTTATSAKSGKKNKKGDSKTRRD
eukprot:gb/GECG01014473.1/.p1 GENE.gb/GECG01014473.1/~~gb/GECG01014473.1/.p1  ORF type:complete len:111 (+),score=10.04 gb/GECG01014473.1/:1-333(+)